MRTERPRQRDLFDSRRPLPEISSSGQAMPEVEMERAHEATVAADLFIVLGSSLVVYPSWVPDAGQAQRRAAGDHQP